MRLTAILGLCLFLVGCLVNTPYGRMSQREAEILMSLPEEQRLEYALRVQAERRERLEGINRNLKKAGRNMAQFKTGQSFEAAPRDPLYEEQLRYYERQNRR